jgi:hypothetical protein
MDASVVRPLAVAHGGNFSRQRDVEEVRGANSARATATSLSDALVVHVAEN